METHLKIEHLAPYLVYGLKVKALKKRYIAFNGIKTDNAIFELEILRANYLGISGYSGMYLYDDFKPILRPLSDLIKEIEVNGEKFMPIDELFKGWKTDKDMKIWWYETELKLSCGNYDLVHFGIIQKLYKWHFAVNIPEHLYININTL